MPIPIHIPSPFHHHHLKKYGGDKTLMVNNTSERLTVWVSPEKVTYGIGAHKGNDVLMVRGLIHHPLCHLARTRPCSIINLFYFHFFWRIVWEFIASWASLCFVSPCEGVAGIVTAIVTICVCLFLGRHIPNKMFQCVFASVLNCQLFKLQSDMFLPSSHTHTGAFCSCQVFCSAPFQE